MLDNNVITLRSPSYNYENMLNILAYRFREDNSSKTKKESRIMIMYYVTFYKEVDKLKIEGWVPE